MKKTLLSFRVLLNLLKKCKAGTQSECQFPAGLRYLLQLMVYFLHNGQHHVNISSAIIFEVNTRYTF